MPEIPHTSDEAHPHNIAEPVNGIQRNRYGLIEGPLSLVFAFFTYVYLTGLSVKATGPPLLPHNDQLILLSILFAITCGLAIGGIRHGYSLGKAVAWFVILFPVPALVILFWSDLSWKIFR